MVDNFHNTNKKSHLSQKKTLIQTFSNDCNYSKINQSQQILKKIGRA